LLGEKQEGRRQVFTVFNQTAAKRDYPMRCLQNHKFGYIYNQWPDGKYVFLNESQNGLSFKAMQRAAEKDPEIAARVKLFQYRVREELYEFEKDPHALVNLVDDPVYGDVLKKMRSEMARTMAISKDPLLAPFTKDVLKK